MNIPAKTICDLCQNEIDPGKPHPRLSYPLDAGERERYARSCTASLPKSILDIAVVVTPDLYVFDLCLGCVEGILPMLADLKRAAIDRLIQERSRRASSVDHG